MLNFRNKGSNLSTNRRVGLEDTIGSTAEFNNIQGVDQGILEAIDAEVTTEDLDTVLDNAVEDMETIEQADINIDNIEDVNTNYEAIATDNPELVDQDLVKTATENLTFSLSNSLGVADRHVDNKINRKIAREETFNQDDYPHQMLVLTGATKNYLEEIRSDLMNVISNMFSSSMVCPNIINKHMYKLKVVNAILKGNVNRRSSDVQKLYAPIMGAYTVAGSDLVNLTNYIANMSIRSVDKIFEGINSGSGGESFHAAQQVHNSLSNGIYDTVISSYLDQGDDIKFVTSIMGSLIHYVTIYGSDAGIRFRMHADPFPSLDGNANSLTLEEVKEVVSGILYAIENYRTIQTEAIETLGTISNMAKTADGDRDVIKAAMAVAVKTARGILHAYDYGIDQLLNICIAEALNN